MSVLYKQVCFCEMKCEIKCLLLTVNDIFTKRELESFLDGLDRFSTRCMHLYPCYIDLCNNRVRQVLTFTPRPENITACDCFCKKLSSLIWKFHAALITNHLGLDNYQLFVKQKVLKWSRKILYDKIDGRVEWRDNTVSNYDN